MKITGEKRDELYLSLICKLFNIYMAEVKDDLVNFDFTVPEFFNKEKFRINLELIPNSLTKDYLKSNKKFEYIFKCILGSFNRKRKKPIGILNDIKVYVSLTAWSGRGNNCEINQLEMRLAVGELEASTVTKYRTTDGNITLETDSQRRVELSCGVR
jgi:hypothetical protein